MRKVLSFAHRNLGLISVGVISALWSFVFCQETKDIIPWPYTVLVCAISSAVGVLLWVKFFEPLSGLLHDWFEKIRKIIKSDSSHSS